AVAVGRGDRLRRPAGGGGLLPPGLPQRQQRLDHGTVLMRDDLIIRRDRPSDVEATERLHDDAFGVPEGRGESLERELVRGLRRDGDVIDELTFVAEVEGEVV